MAKKAEKTKTPPRPATPATPPTEGNFPATGAESAEVKPEPTAPVAETVEVKPIEGVEGTTPPEAPLHEEGNDSPSLKGWQAKPDGVVSPDKENFPAAVWQIESKDDEPFVRLGMLFGKEPKAVEVSELTEEEQQILLNESALLVNRVEGDV